MHFNGMERKHLSISNVSEHCHASNRLEDTMMQNAPV